MLNVTVVVPPPHEDAPPILREELIVFEAQDDVIELGYIIVLIVLVPEIIIESLNLFEDNAQDGF